MTKGMKVFSGMLTERLSRVHMGKELMLHYPSFRHDIGTMDRILRHLGHAPSWSIEGNTTYIA